MTATKSSVLAAIQAAKAAAQAIVAASPPSSGNFATRSAGAVRSWTFNDASQLNSGIAGNCMTLKSNDGQRQPVIDTAMKCEGFNSMRMDIPGNTTNNPGGEWWGNFSPDLSVLFGANSRFYLQTRIRWNDVVATFLFKNTAGQPQGGIKFFDIFAGDVYGGPNPMYPPFPPGITKWGTSSDAKVVVQTTYQHRNPIAYRYLDGNNAPLYENVVGGIVGDQKYQNAMPSPYCLYSRVATVGAAAPIPYCWLMPPNEWITFQIGIALGAKGTWTGQRGIPRNVWLDSTVELWAARDGKPSQKLIDWRPGIGGYAPLERGPDSDDQRLGKVSLMPYFTDKDPKQSHPLGQVWYGPTIVSTQRIADPL